MCTWGTRGTACPFAHGPEELAEIARIVGMPKTSGISNMGAHELMELDVVPPQ